MGKAGSHCIPNPVRVIGDYAFAGCYGLASVTIPRGVTNIGYWAFAWCRDLERVYFAGDAPTANVYTFEEARRATIYYLPGSSGWRSSYWGRPTVLWNPRCQAQRIADGVFCFTVIGTANIPVAIETSADLVTWTRLSATNLVNGALTFQDPGPHDLGRRFYRIASW